jgi:hypothetical protein
MVRAIRLIATAVLGLALLAPVAHAQSDPEPGVTVDPNSPAGQEYSLPADSARKESQGSKKQSSKSGSLFGQGVTSDAQTNPAPTPTTTSQAPPSTQPSQEAVAAARARARAQAKKRAKARSKARARARAKARAKARAAARKRAEEKKRAAAAATSKNSPPPPSVSKLAADANSDSGGVRGSLIFGALGFAVLLLAGLTGLILRRRLRSEPQP